MQLSTLRPTEKMSVYEVLERLGFNLEAWAAGNSGRKIANPAVNGRAYAWSFEDQPSGQHIFMLWHEEMEETEEGIRYRQTWDSVVRDLEKTRPRTASRADDFLRHVSRLKIGTVVRIGIVEGSRSQGADDEASRVARRSLDPEPWHLSYWDPLTSSYEFVRGAPVGLDKNAEGIAEQSEDIWKEAEKSQQEIDLEEILAANLGPTQTNRMISARLGQGRFRTQVLARWSNACAVTGSRTLAAVRGSHCKPWRLSSNEERLDPANGLPLIATLDALFDVGLITFEDDGSVKVSSQLDDPTLVLGGLRLRRPLEADELPYVEYHRRELFLK